MALKNQDHVAPVVSTPNHSPQLSKITQSMIGNFWEYLGDYVVGHTCSKAQKSLSLYTPIMQTSDIITNHAKLVHMLQDTSLNLLSITCS